MKSVNHESPTLSWLALAGVFLVAAPWTCFAQTNFMGFTLFDAPPVNGTCDLVTGPMLAAGEMVATPPLISGLARARLTIQLPPSPPQGGLARATLSLFLEHNDGNVGNSTFGNLSLYHDYRQNSFALSDTDYADTNYVLVKSSVVTPTSPTGWYYDVDVTAQVAKDYSSDGSTPFSDFRFQVDGLQFTGASHYYQFSFVQGSSSYPCQLNLVFAPVLSLDFQSPASGCVLSWSTNYSGYVLESAVLPSAPNWTAVTNQPIIKNGQFCVTNNPANGQRFFRLRQQ